MYKILKAEKLAEKIFLMDVEAPRVARSCQPGEFVIVKMDEKGERIPLTICDFDREKGTVTIVFQIVGASTLKMSELHINARIRSVGANIDRRSKAGTVAAREEPLINADRCGGGFGRLKTFGCGKCWRTLSIRGGRTARKRHG